jgi:hypothetical protein
MGNISPTYAILGAPDNLSAPPSLSAPTGQKQLLR